MTGPNRFIAEVRGGVELFFNRGTDVADGWWWGSDEDPWQRGPFASSEEALADARRGAEQFKLVRWDDAELKRPGKRPLPPCGHIVIGDTGGKLWVKTGERPARAGSSERTAFHKVWREMVESGELVPTGEMRPDSKGVPQPVYVLREFGTRN